MHLRKSIHPPRRQSRACLWITSYRWNPCPSILTTRNVFGSRLSANSKFFTYAYFEPAIFESNARNIPAPSVFSTALQYPRTVQLLCETGVLYVDRGIVATNKPSGISAQDTKREDVYTLVEHTKPIAYRLGPTLFDGTIHGQPRL